MRHASGNVYDVVSLYLKLFVADADGRSSAQDVLLMLNGVGVARHAAAGLHYKAAHGKMRALFGADEHLALGIFAASYGFKR